MQTERTGVAGAMGPAQVAFRSVQVEREASSEQARMRSMQQATDRRTHAGRTTRTSGPTRAPAMQLEGRAGE